MPLLDQISAGDDVKAGLAEVAAKLEGLEGQAHLYASWPPAGVDDDHKIRLLEQVASLDKGYPGGLAAYIASSRALAVVDHLDAPGSWLTAILLADACDAYGGVVVACCETPASEIHALSRKLARGGARDAVTRGMARGTCELIDFFRLDAATGRGTRATLEEVREGAMRAREAARRAFVGDKSKSSTLTSVSSRVCVVVDGADSLSSGRSRVADAAAERFLDALERELGDGVDIVVRAHADVGARAGWLAERADCEIRVEPLRTGSAEDAHGTCETTHRNNAWRAEGAARRSRATFALTELGARLESRG